MDILPQERYFLSVFKGQGAQQEVTIVNNDGKPLNIDKVTTQTQKLNTQLETIERGKKYKITVKLDPQTPVGHISEVIHVHTDNPNPNLQKIPINFNINIRNLVSATPSVVHFSTHKLENLEKLSESLLTRSVTVKKYKENKEFKVEKVTSDSPFLKLELEEAPAANGEKAYKIKVTLLKEKVKRGDTLNGSISVVTNDKDVPELKIPVMGKII